MGFYGNITNVSRTQFQFDHIYPNRKAMEQAKLNDGIYLGRYVLIEYDSDGLDGMKEVVLDNGKYYYGAPNSRTLLTWANTCIDEVIYTKAEPMYIFYKRDPQPNGASQSDPATFTQFTSGNEDTYGRNYAIDNIAYKSSRGYDSTVWQKVYTDNTEKYVMIAELNTVVPKFDIAADAPTMTPVAPHFDTQSTDVYYKLHVQNPWIIRVAEAENGAPSDATVKWQEVIKDEAEDVGEQYKIVTTEKNGAIYFNKAAFDSQVGKTTIAKKADGENKITVDLVSSGLELYDDHNDTTNKPISADDIQELTINLPAIGNMMSDAWDIIHGPNRDNARTDENGSLQGRLDSFKDMAADEIPVKRGSDGTIIGATINGGKTSNQDLTGKNDDAWIETMVNGNIESVTIKHTVNPVDNTSSSSNMNNNGDTIDLYTPKVDAMGHVVGKNTETVTLPYGYKTITVGNESSATDNVNAAAGSVVADNTQDTLTVTPGNKWIHLSANADSDVITLSHEVNIINTDQADDVDLNRNADDIIQIPVWDYDAAGHITRKSSQEYTLPYGYKTFIGNTGSTSAKNTQDSMSIIGDNWMQTTVSNNQIALAHIGPVSGTATAINNETPAFGATFSIDDHYFDERGHKFTSKSHTVQIPLPSLINGTGNIVTGLSLVPTTGALTETKADLGTIKLGTYEGGDNSDNLTADITLQQALSRLQNKIINEATNRQTAIEALNVTDTEVEGQYVSAVNQVDGKIQVSRATLPVYATIEQGAKADSALQLSTPIVHNDTTKTVEELLKMVIDLQAQVVALEARVNENHPIENTETVE